jgi:hypothetical protein
MNIKFLHTPVDNHLNYAFYYDFRCFLHSFTYYSNFRDTYLRKKVVISYPFVSGTYVPQKTLLNDCRRQSNQTSPTYTSPTV